MDQIKRLKQLTEQLNQASRAYYQEDNEIMSNLEYDALYDELEALEEETGIKLSNSPTVNVGYEILGSLPKETHNMPMLSLNKTKSREDLVDWLADQEGILSFKLDGLTIVLTYENGVLQKAVTRGNGVIGEVVTNNARMFGNIPTSIPYKQTLIVRGEAVILYSDFQRINDDLEPENQYKNPRNLCSGSVRQLNNEITKRRNVRFYGFSLVSSDVSMPFTTKEAELQWLEQLGFEIVPYKKVTADSLSEALDDFAGEVEQSDLGSDGLVLTYNDKLYSASLGSTSKFPRDSMAFKWQDELKETKIREVFWSASRTGLINPVAIFEPVELEGTTVTRASLHNISIIEKLELGIDDVVTVYKANMIIPQLADNLTRSGNVEIPTTCPVCDGETVVKEVNEVKVLYCTSRECPAKKVKAFAHFVSRNAMNIDGLSEASLEKLIQRGLIHEFADLFKLDNEAAKAAIVNMEGFGEKSYKKLIDACEQGKHVKLANFIYALGILNVGLSNAKLLTKAYDENLEKIMAATAEELVQIEGFGEVIAESLVSYFTDENSIRAINHLLEHIDFEKPAQVVADMKLEGKTFVVTGSLEYFENRNAIKEVIEELGGKVTGSVSAKTDYLINNDVASASSKNKKAKSLDIPILSETDFLALIE